tara:strand:+ start:168 stop:383 length:216 start_codon:yes stop_codon:yes gene_type:complete
MTDFENKINHAIEAWFELFALRNLIVEGCCGKAQAYILFEDGEAFEYRPWDQLYDEQKKLACQSYWNEMLS